MNTKNEPTSTVSITQDEFAEVLKKAVKLNPNSKVVKEQCFNYFNGVLPTENQFNFLQNPVFSQQSIDKYNSMIDKNTDTNLTFNRQFDNNRLKSIITDINTYNGKNKDWIVKFINSVKDKPNSMSIKQREVLTNIYQQVCQS